MSFILMELNSVSNLRVLYCRALALSHALLLSTSSRQKDRRTRTQTEQKKKTCRTRIIGTNDENKETEWIIVEQIYLVARHRLGLVEDAAN